MKRSPLTTWIVDLAIGCFVGGLTGAIAAVNIVIFLGPEEGYEADVFEVFADSPFVAILAVGAFAAGPVVGTVLVHRFRRAGLGFDRAESRTG